MESAGGAGGTGSAIALDALQAMIDELSVSVAVLDATGLILAVNAAWVQFADENGDPTGAGTGAGTNYLSACNVNNAVDGDFARRAVAGISAVLRRETARFSLEYPCHSPSIERWFVLLAAPFGETGAVVTHVDVSDGHRRLDEPTAAYPPGERVSTQRVRRAHRRPRRRPPGVRVSSGRRRSST